MPKKKKTQENKGTSAYRVDLGEGCILPERTSSSTWGDFTVETRTVCTRVCMYMYSSSTGMSTHTCTCTFICTGNKEQAALRIPSSGCHVSGTKESRYFINSRHTSTKLKDQHTGNEIGPRAKTINYKLHFFLFHYFSAPLVFTTRLASDAMRCFFVSTWSINK